MLDRLEDWRDAPVWNPETIQQATSKWFQYLGDNVTNV
jgi:UDP-glucose 4-epimerase